MWEIKKTSKQILVKFYGTIRSEEKNGRLEFIHENYEPVVAVPYDLPVVGQHYKVNTLRLFGSEPYISDHDLSDMDRAAYLKSIEYRRSVEAISEILYPNDHNYEGKVLRLKQQYFLCAAGLGSIIRTYKKKKMPFSSMADYIAIHINDTHPCISYTGINENFNGRRRAYLGRCLESYNKNNFFYQSHNFAGSFGSMA